MPTSGWFGLPSKFWKMRYSEIASEAILGQKWKCSSCMAQSKLHPIYEVRIDEVGRYLLAESCMNTILFIVAEHY